MIKRNRRLRQNASIRSLVKETNLNKSDFIFPFFVVEGEKIKKEISSLPGNYHYSIDMIDELIYEIRKSNIKGVMIFGIPKKKDSCGSQAFAEDGIVQRAIRKIKALDEDIFIVTDVCMCQYTDHGHCGILKDREVDNDKTLPYIAKIALSHVKAGADMVAPSDMMDGRIKAIRDLLDENNYVNVPIMAYSAKYASAFYGPFREAASSAPGFGDRSGYQMDYGNSDEAMREISYDIEEGADIVMVKPALSYLDVINRAKEKYNYPLAAYNVSGEFSMIKAAAKMGWIDEKKAALEMLTSIKRAGADIIISYYELDVSKWLDERN